MRQQQQPKLGSLHPIYDKKKSKLIKTKKFIEIKKKMLEV